MKSQTFTFGAWMPDLPSTLSAYTANGPVTTLPMELASNCRPGNTPGTYKPFSEWAAVSAINSDLQSTTRVFTATDDNGIRYQFIGTNLNIWLLNTGTGALSNVTYNNGVDFISYSGNNLTPWSFCQYGNRVIATNGVDPVQSYVLGTSTRFEPLAGNPPIAKVVFTFGNFVILGNLLNDVDIGTSAAAYRNSAIDNPTDWTTSTTTQCDVAILNGDGGEITGGIELSSTGLIFQQRNIWRISYIGSPVIFDVKLLAQNVGAGQRSIIADKDISYFWDTTGIYRTNGGAVESISSGKIDTYIKANLANNDVSLISGVADPQDRYLYWGFRSYADPEAESRGTFDKILIYRLDTQEFTVVDHEHRVLGVGVQLAYNLDTIDALSPSGQPGLDVGFVGISFDNPLLSASSPVVGSVVYDSARWGTFSGVSMPASLRTKTIRFHPTKRTQLTKYRPFIESELSSFDSTTVTVNYRNTPQGSYTSTAPSSVGSRGWANTRGSGLELSTTLTIGDAFTSIYGVELQYTVLGDR